MNSKNNKVTSQDIDLDFYLPSEKLIAIDNITEVDDNQRFIQVGDGYKFTLGAMFPDMLGAIQAFAGLTAPNPAWILCDGSELLIADYPQLAKYLGDLYGKPSSSDMFKIPDLRGQFLRGANESHPVATKQDDMMREITGIAGLIMGYNELPTGSFYGAETTKNSGFQIKEVFKDFNRYNVHFSSKTGIKGQEGQQSPNVGNETRPANFSINWYIHS